MPATQSEEEVAEDQSVSSEYDEEDDDDDLEFGQEIGSDIDEFPNSVARVIEPTDFTTSTSNSSHFLPSCWFSHCLRCKSRNLRVGLSWYSMHFACPM